jgi:hypothetical protein
MSGYSGYSGTSGYSGFTGMTGASAASAAECLLSFEEFDESVQVSERGPCRTARFCGVLKPQGHPVRYPVRLSQEAGCWVEGCGSQVPRRASVKAA